MKYIKNIKDNASKEFPLKRFSLGRLYIWPCILLSAALSACPPSPNGGGGDPLEEVYTVIFDKNGGDTEANPQSKTVEPPATTIDALPEAPTREDHIFVGWRTAADGSGTPFTANTLVRESLTVYAQWEPRSPQGSGLNVSISSSEKILTPIINGTYNEHSTTFRVVVSGFDNAADASKATLSINHINGLSFEVESNPEGNTQIFEVSVTYNGQAAFVEGFATVQLSLANISGYSAESRNTRIYIRDGQAASPSRAIPVNQDNILAFNRYVNTEVGLTRHYGLTGNINLDEPAQPTASNWTAIGGSNSSFTGSFNGNGHTIFGLRIRASGSDNQGLFSRVERGAIVENLGLIDVSVSGRNNVGGLVGSTREGTVQNCYVTGSVSGDSDVGGLVGTNRDGTVQNSYATVSVTGTGNAVGGLVGENREDSIVQNSYATGSVSGSGIFVGGLVGYNYAYSTVQNSYATGSVIGNRGVGGLVGFNMDSTVQNSLALNPSVVGAANVLANYIGRVVGEQDGSNASLRNNYAFSGMTNRDNNTTWDSIGLDDRGGANRTAEALQREEGFPAAFGATPWTYAPGRLPGLLGQTVEMPAHLSP